LSDDDLTEMITKRVVEPPKPKRVGELNFSEMLGASDNQKKLEDITALQLSDLDKYQLTEAEFNEMLPIRRKKNDVNSMSFSEMLTASSNQDKLYEINALGIDSDLGRYPDSWELSDGEQD